MYKSCGAELKKMILEIDGLKPNLLQILTKRMQEIDEGKGSKYVIGSQGGDFAGHHYTGNDQKDGLE